MEQGQAGGAEGTSETEGYLGDPGTTADRPPYARAGALQSRHRQQAAIVRFGEITREGHLSWKCHRIIRSWIREIGLDASAYGTHTLRRMKASLIYRRTKNLRVVQLLLGHTKLESTVRYLGIEVDDALEISEQTEV